MVKIVVDPLKPSGMWEYCPETNTLTVSQSVADFIAHNFEPTEDQKEVASKPAAVA